MPLSLRTLVAVAASILIAGLSHGQNPDEPGFRPEEYGLDPAPIRHAGLGLTMFVPAGAQVTPVNQGSQVELHIRDLGRPSTGPAWQMRIDQIVMRNLPDPTPEGVVAGLVEELKRGGETEVLTNEPMQLGERVAHLLYVESNEEVGGYLIASTGSERYLVFRVGTVRESYERTRRALDPAFRTIRLTSASELERERARQVELAAAALRKLTPDRMRQIVGRTQWFRVYKPSPTGNWRNDREIGYFRVTVEEAGQKSVNPGTGDTSHGPLGLLVSIDARYLEDAERQSYADVQTRMWLAWDRSEETWQTRATRRQGEAAMTEAEVGIRPPQSLGAQRLKVVRNNVQTRERKEYDWTVEPPYLSQAEVFLLGALLPRDGSITGTMAFNYYESTLPPGATLPVRRDTWRPATDGSGQWTLSSQLVPDTPAVESQFDREGFLLKRMKPDGTVTEPIELDRLLEIWRSKRLPTGA